MGYFNCTERNEGPPLQVSQILFDELKGGLISEFNTLECENAIIRGWGYLVFFLSSFIFKEHLINALLRIPEVKFKFQMFEDFINFNLHI